MQTLPGKASRCKVLLSVFEGRSCIWHVSNQVLACRDVLLGVRKSTANHMILAELGRFPLQIHFWQQILHYHHRTIALDNVRLIKLAMVDGFALDRTAVKDSWQHYVGGFLHGHFRTAAAFSQV